MKKLLAVILVFITLSAVTVCGEVRREPESKKQDRKGLCYIENEQTAYTGILFSLHENGQLASEGTYKDGKVDGVVKGWYENGQLRIEAFHKASVAGATDGADKDWSAGADGVWKTWYENGQLKSESTYKDRKAIGVWKVWYENGQLELEETFKDDKLDGVLKEWHENGQLKSEQIYKDGNPLN